MAATEHQPEPAVAPPPGNPRFPLLDGVRAIAALSVLVLHVGDATGWSKHGLLGAFTARGDVGVAIFFVLSGFLLYRPFAAARLDGRPLPSVSRYVRRRLLRIVPAFWAAMLVMVALGWITFTLGWWRYFLFLQSYELWTMFSGIGPAWSLCVEIAFYLALPLWVIAASRLRGRPRAEQLRLEALALLALAAASLALRVAIYEAVGEGTLWLSSLPLFLDWFAAGMLLAVASLAFARPPRGALGLPCRHPAVAWAFAMALFAVVSLALGLPRGLAASPNVAAAIAKHVLYIVIAVLVALPGVFGVPLSAGRLSRAVGAALGNPLMMWLGLVSYGIFLWHHPLLMALVRGGLPSRVPFPFVTTLVATLACAVALGAASYYLVERPLLRFKDPRRSPHPATGAEPVPTTAD